MRHLGLLAATAVPLDISFQPMRVLIDGHDSEGKLILADSQLAAVIVPLDGEHHDPERKRRWHLEAGFGKCSATRECVSKATARFTRCRLRLKSTYRVTGRHGGAHEPARS
ncbi:hypothetical protein FS320_44480, partial [Microvirga tunisiensis]